MTNRQQFWLRFTLYFQFFVIAFFAIFLFSPEPIANRMSLAVGLAKIHDLVIEARHAGKEVSKAEVEKKVLELKQNGYGGSTIEVIGSDTHWTVIWTMATSPQSKLEALVLKNYEWPIYVLSSDDDGFIQISPQGRTTHRDFNWEKAGENFQK